MEEIVLGDILILLLYFSENLNVARIKNHVHITELR